MRLILDQTSPNEIKGILDTLHEKGVDTYGGAIRGGEGIVLINVNDAQKAIRILRELGIGARAD